MTISGAFLIVVIILVAIFFKQPISRAAKYAGDEVDVKVLESNKKLHTKRCELEDWLKEQNRKPLTIEELEKLFNMHSDRS